MNKRICLGVFAVTALTAFNSSSVKAIEPVSMAAGALVVAGVGKAIDGIVWLFSPSQTTKDYEARHERLNLFTKKEFVDDIDTARNILGKTDLEILSQHELYRYKNFIDAIKEICPGYAEYIKTLMLELDNNPTARLVRGFETDHLYHKGSRILKKRSKDFSQFYILIQKLYAEVLAQEVKLEEQQLALAKHQEELARGAASDTMDTTRE